MEKFNLINSFEIDWESEMITVKGGRRVLDDGVKYHIESMEETLTIQNFINFCKICIASKQGESEDFDMHKFGVDFFRVSFDHRFFSMGTLQVFVGEAYIMYEILTHHMDTTKFNLHKIDSLYIFMNHKGNLILSDKTMLNVGVFRYYMFYDIEFNPGDKPKKGEIGYNKEVSVGNIQTVKMTRGACHPYVELRYRDMVVNISLSDWTKLKELCSYYRYDFISED